MKPKSFRDLLQELQGGDEIQVETGPKFSRTLSYENGTYFEQTPEGKKGISLEEAQGHLRVLVARRRRERREQRRGKR